MTRNRLAAAAMVLAVALLPAGCGEDTPALPDVPSMPSIPAELPDAAKDPDNVKKLICGAGNAWIDADGTQRKIVEPGLRKLTGHYRESSDETVKNLALAGDALLTARGAAKDAAASEFRKHC
jgi:hypothetical protein